jgi:hypothetical protein
MKRRLLLMVGLMLALVAGLCADEPAKDKPKPDAYPPKAGADKDGRSGWPDSFKYYGPNGLWKTWNESQKLGRDTWIFWTGGNQKFLRLGTLLGGQQQVPISIEYFRVLDSRHRGDRFKTLGLINEPNCVPATKPDEYGLWLDEWKGDPEDYYPTKYYPYYEKANGLPSYAQTGAELYGEPTGVVGLRKFKNPKFDKSKWDVKKYFDAPWAMEPPYHVGFSCAFCHMSFDPTNPPKDPENPRWENMAANMGNQYFKEGDIFFGRGRFLFGDRNPGPNRAADPYDTEGLNGKSLLFYYAITQQPGTSETSRISYDFINNPNTINSIFYLGDRPKFPERTPDGKLRIVNHILKDGSDSVGVDMALLRVWVNIFCEGRYWIDDLYNPGTGRRQKPFDLNDLRLNARADDELSDAEKTRRDELRARYGPDVGKDWAEAHRRNPHLLGYLASYTPYHLQDAPGGKQALPDESKTADKAALDNGKQLFAGYCAECHSNKQPMYSLIQNKKEKEHFFRDSVTSPGFLDHNTLSDDVRYRVTEIGTNMARALATNAVDGDIWAELSSKDYKALPPLGSIRLQYVFKGDQLLPKLPGDKPDPKNDLTQDFTPPGGGRGYYRTPTLVSMWATAPYFHNNALGDYYVVNTKTNKKFLFPNDGRDLRDTDGTPLTIDTSVEGRLKMFDDAVAKLLWPEKRRLYIKRTATDCDIIDLQPVVKPFLVGILSNLLSEFLEEEIARQVDAYIADKGLPAAAAAPLRQGILTQVRQKLQEVQDQVKPADLAALKERLATLAKEKLAAAAAEAAGADHAAALKAKLAGLAGKFETEAKELLATDVLKVPKGTPVNLYFNLSSGALPYALKAQIKYRNDPRQLQTALLSLSDCPDLVEDKGHTYGAQLTDDQKRDLIAFLKTL